MASPLPDSNPGGSPSGGPGGGTPSGGGHHRRKQGGVTPQSWAESLLNALGVPVTKANVQSIVSWEAMEGGNWHNDATFNPLNTTQPEPGSSSATPAGAQSYDSWSSGLTGTVSTLHNGSYNDVLAALKTGKGLFGRDLHGLSVWSGGGYDVITPHTGYGGGDGTTIGQAQLTSADPATCAISLPSEHLFLFFGPEIGGQCLLTKSEVRALLGSAVLISGLLVTLYGLSLLFKATGPQQAQNVIGFLYPELGAARGAAKSPSAPTQASSARRSSP